VLCAGDSIFWAALHGDVDLDQPSVTRCSGGRLSSRKLQFGNDGRPQQPALLFGALDKFVKLFIELDGC
jgi:hypothetical protein